MRHPLPHPSRAVPQANPPNLCCLGFPNLPLHRGSPTCHSQFPPPPLPTQTQPHPSCPILDIIVGTHRDHNFPEQTGGASWMTWACVVDDLFPFSSTMNYPIITLGMDSELNLQRITCPLFAPSTRQNRDSGQWTLTWSKPTHTHPSIITTDYQAP